MDAIFQQYIEQLHPLFELLLNMVPVKISNLPKGLPQQFIYLFSEGERHLYVGRSNHFRNRFRQHSIDTTQHNQAVLAFRLARESTGRTEVSYKSEESRKALLGDPIFDEAFPSAKRRVRVMDLRYVEEADQLARLY
jgi:predicted GIY-YIG superfamily endonuclease